MPTHRTDRQITLLLLAFALGLYWRTMAPGLLAGDSGEFQVAAWRLGLAHPTGYPFYLLLGSAWQHTLALIGINPATALTAFSALIGALAIALLYIIMRDWLQGSLNVRRGAALFTAVLFTVNPTFWSQNLIAEVYTLHVLFILLILRVYQQIEFSYLLPTVSTTTVVITNARQPASLLGLFLLVGLALTHHGMVILLLPGLLLALWLLDRRWWRSPRLLIGAALVTLLPLLLYFYIPMRSGLAASPWYHQALGTERLDLYQNNGSSFLNFITGRSISVGFYSIAQALANLPQAGLLWRLHFYWPGLLLMAVGLFVLIRQRRWTVLAFTLSYAVLQQVFNLFYGIGDILIYYIPLYLIGAIWAGFAANALGNGLRITVDEPGARPFAGGLFLIAALFFIPFQSLRINFSPLDQSGDHTIRQTWEAIMAAQPAANAVLVSNDRDEIVPLFYLQAVEKRALGMTGLFPLLSPDPRFADIGKTVETALAQGGGQPVYLIKPMPGLEVKFALEAAQPPLVRVVGLAAQDAPEHSVDQPFGPLRLVGYDWQKVDSGVRITLHWLVQEKMAADYTSTVQLFDATGAKLTQNDQQPGGVYYPTSLWKPGETLVDRHQLTWPADRKPVTLLIGMYVGPEFIQLAPPLKIELSPASVDRGCCLTVRYNSYKSKHLYNHPRTRFPIL